jgi:hypothetical protein
MSLQYLINNEGNRTAVVIPIAEWELLTLKHPDLKSLEKPKVIDNVKPSDFFGTLPKDMADEMQEHIKKSREEWEWQA